MLIEKISNKYKLDSDVKEVLNNIVEAINSNSVEIKNTKDSNTLKELLNNTHELKNIYYNFRSFHDPIYKLRVDSLYLIDDCIENNDIITVINTAKKFNIDSYVLCDAIGMKPSNLSAYMTGKRGLPEHHKYRIINYVKESIINYV